MVWTVRHQSDRAAKLSKGGPASARQPLIVDSHVSAMPSVTASEGRDAMGFSLPKETA